MAEYDYDLFVIGAGSGGTRAARVSASYGARVAVAEEYRVGGTCVIRGCVPKKLLVYGSHFSEELEDGKNFGWTWDNAKFDWARLRDHVLKDVDRLNNAYTDTLKNHGVEIILERAELTGPHEIKLAGGRTVTAKYILIAVGAWPAIADFPGSDLMSTSNDMFHLDKLPETIIISGGGYIANEFAGIFNGLGSDVTVVNRSNIILRGYDESVRDRLIQISLAKGMNYKFNCTFDKIERRDDGALDVYMDGKSAPVRADVVLAATGRRPKIDGLGLDQAGVTIDEKGAIPVDEYSQTNVDHIYAVGDVTDRVQLTPVAIREGQAFADTVFGDNPPSAVFSQPPIASVGLTESEARDQYGNIKVYSSDFRAMRNVFADRPERSLYKMIVEHPTEKILGLHMIGPDAPEILQAAAVAVKAGLTKQAFDDTVALHPSMAEELVLFK